MPTLTIRSVPPSTIDRLRALASRNDRSMEQEVREMLNRYVARRRVLQQVEDGWAAQARRPAADEIDRWMGIGRL